MGQRVVRCDEFCAFVDRRSGCKTGSWLDTNTCVVYPCLSSSSDDHHLLHSCLGTGMRGGAQNKFCHYFASLVHSASANVFISLLVCWWGSISILPFLVHIFRTFATGTTPVLCVLVNTLQHHDTVDFVQDSETEDPHLDAMRLMRRVLE